MKKKNNYYNIFQGNEQIKKVIADCFEFEGIEFNQFYNAGSDMFFESYFYLTQRFGEGKKEDNYKDSACWLYKVKNYKISVFLSSTRIEVIMFGKGNKKLLCKNNFSNYPNRTPYMMKFWRARRKYKKSILDCFVENQSKSKTKKINVLFDKWLKEQNVDVSMSQKEFDEKHLWDWVKYVDIYNKEKVCKLPSQKDWEAQHGKVYSNAKTRHALRTLEQFLHNMMTPIYVRDCAFNIKGRVKTNEYDKYINNIKFELLK